jgi:hypothetical protein
MGIPQRGGNLMTHEELIHALEIVGDAACRIFSETFKVFADYIKQKDIEIEARDAEIRRLRTMIADHECSGVPFGEAYRRTPNKLTNLEWLRSLSVEKYAAFMADHEGCPPILCPYEGYPIKDFSPENCPSCWVQWLKEEHTDDGS